MFSQLQGEVCISPQRVKLFSLLIKRMFNKRIECCNVGAKKWQQKSQPEKTTKITN